MLVLENPLNSDWQLDCGSVGQRGARLLASAQWADCSFLLGQREVPQKAHRRYIYTDQIDLDSHITAIDLYFAAQKYMLRRLQRLCTTYLSCKLSPQNACRIYEFAYCIADRKLENKSLKMIKAETKVALSDSSFEHLSLATVISIFSMDDVTIDSELDLFIAAERYYLAHQEGLMEMSTDSTPLSNVKPEDDHKVKANTNNNGVTDKDNGRKSKPHDNGSTQREQDEESVINPEILSSDLPLVCVDIEKEDDIDPARSEATFRFTVHNIKTLKKIVLSPPCFVRDLPWKIKVIPIKEHEQKHLGLYLECNANDKSSSWSCAAKYEFRLLNNKSNLVPIYKIEHLFCSNENDWGYEKAMTWDSLLDPNKGYVKDDSITVEVHVTAQEPEGIPLSMKKLSEMRDVSIQTLIKQIRFLTLTVQELAEYEPKSTLLKEHDIHTLMMNIASTKTYLRLPKMFSQCRTPRTALQRNAIMQKK